MYSSHTSQRSKNKSLLITTFLLFVMTTILTISFVVVYQQTSKKLQTIALEESSQSTSQSAENISSALRHTITLFTNSTLRKHLNDLMKGHSDSISHATLLALHEEMKSYFYSNNYLQDIGLFIDSPGIDYMCSVNFISDDFERDYKDGLYSFEDLNYSSFRDMIVNSVDTRKVHYNYFTGFVTSNFSNRYSANILYMVYPFKPAAGSLKIYAVMQLNLDNLSKELLSSPYSGHRIRLYDRNGLIYSTDDNAAFEVNNAPYFYYSDTDTWYIRDFIGDLGITCYIALDTEKIYNGVTPFSKLLFCFFIITVITFALLIWFLLQYWLLPIFKIANSIPDHPDSAPDMIAKINHHLTALTSQNNATISKLRDYRKEALLKKLYTGKNLSDAELTALSDFPFIENNYRCICLGPLDGGNMLADTVEILAALDSFHLSAAAGTLIDELFICLLPQKDSTVYQESSELYRNLNSFLESLNQQNYLFAIGISDVYNGYPGISTAYLEAYSSWKNAVLWQNAAVVFNTSLSQYSSNYTVSYSQLDALYNAIITNHKETALQLYQQLVAENLGDIKKQRIRTLYWQQFEHDILGILIRISTQYDIYAIIESYLSISGNIPLSQRITLLQDAITQSSEFIPIHHRDTDMANAIHKYCTEHYCDYQLSLSVLGEEFHLSQSSLSKFFKAHFGINFTTYIERMRIEHAQELLMERKYTVREIASHVGYQNITTFYNVFKKIKKCTPTEWRDQQDALANLGSKK